MTSRQLTQHSDISGCCTPKFKGGERKSERTFTAKVVASHRIWHTQKTRLSYTRNFQRLFLLTHPISLLIFLCFAQLFFFFLPQQPKKRSELREISEKFLSLPTRQYECVLCSLCWSFFFFCCPSSTVISSLLPFAEKLYTHALQKRDEGMRSRVTTKQPGRLSVLPQHGYQCAR